MHPELGHMDNLASLSWGSSVSITFSGWNYRWQAFLFGIYTGLGDPDRSSHTYGTSFISTDLSSQTKTNKLLTTSKNLRQEKPFKLAFYHGSHQKGKKAIIFPAVLLEDYAMVSLLISVV